MPINLPKDATLRDLAAKLTDADTYVSKAYGVMHAASKERGAIVMRIGVTGTGKIPNYRLEDATTSVPFRAYDGGTHEPWPPHEDFSSPANWSTATMSKEEVATLLGEIRNFRPKGQLR
jgi:hypothetical protein